MDESTFIRVVHSICRADTPASLDRPVAETGLDSFDLMAVRSALEAQLQQPIADHTWLNAATLRELLNALP